MCESVLWEELLFIQVNRLVGGELVQVELEEDSSSSINISDFRCSVELDAGSVGEHPVGRELRSPAEIGGSPLSTHKAVVVTSW